MRDLSHVTRRLLAVLHRQPHLLQYDRYLRAAQDRVHVGPGLLDAGAGGLGQTLQVVVEEHRHAAVQRPDRLGRRRQHAEVRIVQANVGVAHQHPRIRHQPVHVVQGDAGPDVDRVQRLGQPGVERLHRAERRRLELALQLLVVRDGLAQVHGNAPVAV